MLTEKWDGARPEGLKNEAEGRRPRRGSWGGGSQPKIEFW